MMHIALAQLAGTADVIVNPLPQPVITGDFEICDGESSVLYAPAGNTAYLWSNGLTSSSIITTTPGIITVMVTDNNGCIGTSPAINFHCKSNTGCEFHQ
jgi:hypothetical protein